MNERERPRHDDRAADASGAIPFGSDLDSAREEARRLLSAGRAAINRALSSNSQEFLDAKRQAGGQ